MSTASTGGLPLAHTPSTLNESAPAQSSGESVRPLAFDELTIEMCPHDLPFCDYLGTRAQLEAEGLIPAETVWLHGFRFGPCWEAHGLKFTLSRRRPPNARGPRSAFLNCDSWRLRIELPGSNAFAGAVARKAKELRDLRDSLKPVSAAAREERQARTERYVAAVQDEKFQAFKKLVPCLVSPPRKRRRPAAAANRSQEA